MSEFLLKLMQAGIVGSTENKNLYIIGIFVVILFSYLVGSANFCRMAAGKAGIENSDRCIGETYGKKAFLYFMLDALKGLVCSIVGFIMMPGAGFASVAMLFCIFGHGYPIYFKFKSKGDAGVYATMFGCSLVINPIIALIALLISGITYFAFRYSSLSGMIYAVLFGFLNDRFMMWKFVSEEKTFVSIINVAASYGAPLVCMLLAILIFSPSFARLVRGKEEKTYFTNKKNKKE